MNSPPKPGQLLARGAARHLRHHDFVSMEEFTLDNGLRVDLLAVGPKGEIWVIECKSSRLDFVSDAKWRGYLDYCDRYFWAVDLNFPVELLPGTTGLIVADQYDAEIIKMGEEAKLAPARRRKMLLKFARNAADRLNQLREAGRQQRAGALEIGTA